MSRKDDVVLRDVTSAGLVISDRIGREMASQLDLEEVLEASRYASHPYSSHPIEWPHLVEVVDTWELPPVLIERYYAAGGEGMHYMEYFQKYIEHGHLWITPCFSGVLTSGHFGIETLTRS